MAQVIAPEIWQEGIDDNRLLPGRYTTGKFIGNTGCQNIANNPSACRVWDIQITDYITDYDDRRINGLGNTSGALNFNVDGRDGWGASAYGVFQDVRFDSRVYTMGRHRSIAMRLFDEMQYAGPIGAWGDATTSNVITNGQALMKTAALLSKARDLWQQEVLGPDIDSYNMFAIANGHMAGRWVPDAQHVDKVMDGDASHGSWQAQPGMVQSQPITPRFAPIHCIQWNDEEIPMMLAAVKVAWNNLFIPEDNRVCMIDPNYEYSLLSALTGKGVPATEAAYNDIRDGKFTKLMGWDFDFTVPSQYWPKIYIDANMNVVHANYGSGVGAAGTNYLPFDRYAAVAAALKTARSGVKTPGEDLNPYVQGFVDALRDGEVNYVRTTWDSVNHKFVKTVTNYPLGLIKNDDFYGISAKVTGAAVDDDSPYETAIDELYAQPGSYPFAAAGSGYGDPETVSMAGASATLTQVIGMFVYRKAAQLSQEYSEMVTDEGRTRGKFTECCMDVKYDAWVIEQLSHGIVPIVKGDQTHTPYDANLQFAIPVKVIEGEENA